MMFPSDHTTSHPPSAWGPQQPTWRDLVEQRLGGLTQGLAQTQQTQAYLREDYKALAGDLDKVRSELATQIAAGMGALRADLLSLRTTPTAAPPQIDWRMVALVAAVVAGLLVGAGIAIGKAWDAEDVKTIIERTVT